jgi:GNAT superfamily N-acetyltransferase
MQFFIKDLAKVTPAMRSRLTDATPVGDDFMRAGAKYSSKSGPGKFLAIALFAGNQLIGWSMLDFMLSQDSPLVRTYIFVKTRHRRKGYGTLIMQKAKQVAKRRGRGIRVCPYNKSSRKFFQSVRISKSEVAPGYDLYN